MTNTAKPYIGMIRAVFFICLSFTHVTAADPTEDTAKLKKIGVQIHTLQKGIKNVSKKIQQLGLELETAERKLIKTKGTISTLKKGIAQAQSKLKQLQNQKQQLERLKAAQQQATAKQINVTYRTGRESTLKLLLNQENANEISRLLRYHDYFLHARANRLNEYLSTLKKLTVTEQNINNTLKELNVNQNNLVTQIEQQVRAQESRSSTLAILSKSLTTDNQKLQQLQVEKTRLEAVIEKLTQSISSIVLPDSITTFTSQKGKLAWPVKGVLKNSFGQTRNTKIKWDGWLVSARKGAKINVIHHGRVIFSDYLRGHGLLIVIDHGEGYMSLYAHNQILLAETGEWVSSGAAIAEAGQTGGQNNTGLYFEIRRNGKPTNPSAWLKPKG